MNPLHSMVACSAPAWPGMPRHAERSMVTSGLQTHLAGLGAKLQLWQPSQTDNR